MLVFQQAMDAKAPRPWILLLQVQDLFEKRERQLIVGMGRGAGPLVLQACKTIPLKGRNDRIDVRPCHLETASNALFVPPFVPHPDDGPAGLIGIRKLREGQQVELQLDGDGKALEEMFDGVVIGRIAEFPLHDADDFAGMDGGIELFEIEDMRRNSLWIDMPLPPQITKTLIDEAEHALHGKTAGFRAHDGPFNA